MFLRLILINIFKEIFFILGQSYFLFFLPDKKKEKCCLYLFANRLKTKEMQRVHSSVLRDDGWGRGLNIHQGSYGHGKPGKVME